MATTVSEQSMADTLWVLSKVGTTTCAVNSAYVQAIFLLQEEPIGMPDSDEVHVGIIRFRGAVLPVIDTRRLMGMKSLHEEAQEFEQMLDIRKQDHVHWVDELARCVREGDGFTLATDPHKCAFGRWYDHYKTDSHSLAFQLQRIDEPHKKLHATAVDVFSEVHGEDDATLAARQDKIVTRHARDYMNQVVELLDETKQVLRQSYHRMIVVIADKRHSLGLMVDEVLSVEALSDVAQHVQLVNAETASIISRVAQRTSDQELILLINETSLLGDPITDRYAKKH